jgi:hypothetical protein
MDAAISPNAQVSCDPGDVATGGGFFNVEATSAVLSSNPLNVRDVPGAWSVQVQAGDDSDDFTAYVVCADTTP